MTSREVVITGSGSGDQPSQPHQRSSNSNLDPQLNQVSSDVMKLLAVQTQLLQNLANIVVNLQAQVNQPPAVQPRNKHREFMSHQPPTYSHSTDPLQADYWLKSVEKKLVITQCNDMEKVLYASGMLEGPAANWWDFYKCSHADPSTITWSEFKNNFRAYHIPASVIKLKKEEFLSLKQEGMSVYQYRDKFIQLSRYAPEEVLNDDKKQDHFLEGLNESIQCQLVAHTFPNFEQLVDKAILVEHKRLELVEKRRKLIFKRQLGTNTRPRFTEPQPSFYYREHSGNLEQDQFQYLDQKD